MSLTPTEAWDRLLRVARDRVSEQTFRTWLEPAVPHEFKAGRLVVRVADQFAVDWNEKKHAALLTALAPVALGEPCEVMFRADEERQQRTGQIDLFSPSRSSSTPVAIAKPVLSSRYTFDQFVIGTSNEVAAAAAQAVANAPGRMFNPLFIYGATGVGKTHLMQAVAHAINTHDATQRIVYLSTEQFTNEYITAIKSNTMSDFRRKFRETDLLLVDDVHILKGKEATQEEFFHTFNAIYEAGRQIILTSDRPPGDLGGVEARLVSRFQWGMVSDIALPDLELRIAILRKKAELDQLQRTIADDVIRFLAEHIRSNVRELESAVIRLLAYGSLKRREITVALAQEALRDKLRRSTSSNTLEELTPITALRIQETIATQWGVTVDALKSKARTKSLTIPRQAAMYLCRELLGMHLIDIGTAFGNRDHSTVIHSLARASEQLLTDTMFLQRVELAKRALTT
ncbi:MAG: chromosomal replication initiator protein DnaA [Gemmatimonadaceae bacterium]|nr:chromosomal replication initiator protein DnaA [Gemmatimonadaceae bacterium]